MTERADEGDAGIGGAEPMKQLRIGGAQH